MKRLISVFLLLSSLAAAQQPSSTPAPTEMLLGPRAEEVMPEHLEIGKQYHLQILGKNFEVGTTITFGDDVQVIGLPFVASPTTAYVDVLVSLAAVAGVRPATATNKEGSNVGPGGVFVGPLLPDPAAQGKKKAKKKPTPTPTPAG